MIPLIALLLIVILVELIIIEVRFKRKMEIDKKMLDRLDLIIKELERLKGKVTEE
ncbi:hypothetical protein ACE3NQ_08360 [Paenibacillus terreus]|uniref:DUF4083 domain-containing protein n=1 Tax=Paenibacillus terreus TaxID=1387834 RepID=A0ABV5B7S3_9BACL